MKESLVEKFTPRVRKHSKDSGGECSNYTLGLGEKFNTPSMATVGSPDLPVYTSCSSLSSSQNVGPPCRQQFPGCQVVLNDEGFNDALASFVSQGGNLGHAGKVQLSTLLDKPETERVNNTFRTTGVNDPNWVSPNQKLVGKPNPKFLIPPVIVAPSHDLDFWRTNNLVVRSHINATDTFDEQSSGYVPRDLNGFTNCSPGLPKATCYQLPNTEPCPDDPKPVLPLPKHFEYEPPMKTENGNGNGGSGNENGNKGKNGKINGEIIEPFMGSDPADFFAGNQFASENKSLIGQEKPRILECTSCDQLVEDHCVLINNGYHQDNLAVGLPTNYPASECEKQASMTEFNTDLFTSTIIPGVYQNSQIIEPINSNIGISFTQQIPPTTLSTENGELLYEQHDPNLFEPPPQEPPRQTPDTSNVTDPRFTGYGASNRSYIEPMTGQTRFYYKDVDAIRMPNYISRSKIDVNGWADKYGPLPDGHAEGNPATHDIRILANNAFRDATIEQRTSLMQSLMRKRNAELYQMRLMPKSAHTGVSGANHRG